MAYIFYDVILSIDYISLYIKLVTDIFNELWI